MTLREKILAMPDQGGGMTLREQIEAMSDEERERLFKPIKDWMDNWTNSLAKTREQLVKAFAMPKFPIPTIDWAASFKVPDYSSLLPKIEPLNLRHEMYSVPQCVNKIAEITDRTKYGSEWDDAEVATLEIQHGDTKEEVTAECLLTEGMGFKTTVHGRIRIREVMNPKFLAEYGFSFYYKGMPISDVGAWRLSKFEAIGGRKYYMEFTA